MDDSRRSFLKKTGVSSLGAIAVGVNSCYTKKSKSNIHEVATEEHKQVFNMCGYAAPPITTVRLGYIGIGGRGLASVKRMRLIEGVEIKALCDINVERIKMGQDALEEIGLSPAREYTGSNDAWMEMVQNQDLDLIYVATPRSQHVEQSVFAMENGKHVASEHPAAESIEDAWRLVKVSEKTKKHFCFLENCTYDFFEMQILNMARQGYFGEIVHVDAAYIHDMKSLILGETRPWLIDEFVDKKAQFTPTHGLGPAAQLLDINRGDRFDYMTSMSACDFNMRSLIAERAIENPHYDKYADRWQLGNISIATIRTARGKTIMLQASMSTTRPYTRIHWAVGTEGIAKKWPLPPRIAKGHNWLGDEDMKILEKKYTPPLIRLVGETAKKAGGHGGMDFIMEWRLIDCLRNGLPIDQDVYDAASWCSIIPLSDWSAGNESVPVRIPDFTCGAYKTNIPVDIEMKNGGGNTGIKGLS